MAKMISVVLLASLTTVRAVDGKDARVTFQPGDGKNGTGKAVSITEDEKNTLDKLGVSTGRAHYRMPRNESSDDAEANLDPADSDDEFDGASIAMDIKTVAQLKAYLDFHSVEYTGSDKAKLLAAAQAHAADPDAGL